MVCLPPQALSRSASDPAVVERLPAEDVFKLAREGTIKIFSRRADEREALKTKMVREEQFAFERMVAHYTSRSKSWAKKLQKNPLAADQVALDNKAYRVAQAREAAEQRQRAWEQGQQKKIQRGVLQRAAAEGKDELDFLRSEKKKLLELERVLKAKRDQERFEERVANMGAPRRCVKHLIEKKEKKPKPVEGVKEVEDWTAVSVITMATEIMAAADKGSQNGLVSVGELMAFLSSNKRYHSFSDWLLADGKKRFREFDKDKSGDMSLMELHAAVKLFVAEKQEAEKQQKEAEAEVAQEPGEGDRAPESKDVPAAADADETTVAAEQTETAAETTTDASPGNMGSIDEARAEERTEPVATDDG